MSGLPETPESWKDACEAWPPLIGLEGSLGENVLAAAAAELFGGEGSWVTELLQPNARDVLAIEVGFIGEDARLRAARFFGHMSPAFHELAAREGIGVDVVIQERMLSLRPPERKS